MSRLTSRYLGRGLVACLLSPEALQASRIPGKKRDCCRARRSEFQVHMITCVCTSHSKGSP